MSVVEASEFAARAADGMCIVCGVNKPSPGTHRCGPCHIRAHGFRELHAAKRRRDEGRIAHFERKLGVQSKPRDGDEGWTKHTRV